VYQSGVCSSGSLHGVLSGSHYNRAWSVHSSVFEAMERLFLTRFLAEKKPNIPESIVTYVTSQSNNPNENLLKQMSTLFEK